MSNFTNTVKKIGTALVTVALLTACGGGGGSTKIVVDYQALQKAKLEDDLKTLTTASS